MSPRRKNNKPSSARPHDRVRRARPFMFALAALILVPCLFYGWSAVQTTRELRIRNALDRNEAVAALSARVLDEQSTTSRAVLRILARRYDLAESLRANAFSTLRSDVASMVDLAPNLAYAAVYQPDGRMIADYPAVFRVTRDASNEEWFQGVVAARAFHIGGVIRLADDRRSEAMVMALPLGKSSRPAGYLLAYYRLAKFETWLGPLSNDDLISLYIVTMQGRVIAHSPDAPSMTTGFKDTPVLRDIRKRKSGDSVLSRTGKGDPLLAGYALASAPGWVVVVTQPSNAAVSSTNFLAARLSLTYVPVLLLMLLAARALIGVYRRQEEAGRQLEDQNLRLRQADQAKSDFLANVSHDLWTPLAGIQLSLSVLLDPNIKWTQQQVQEHLHSASIGLSQISNRVRNLLEMARLETNADLAAKEPCDLWDLTSSALERMEPLLQGREICTDFPEQPLMFLGRYLQIEIVLMNLLENAIKYSPPGSPLYLSAGFKGEFVQFSLRDCGPGVNLQDGSRIFEKFYRGHPGHQMSGTGLGLAICKGIVESHGGMIGVMNAPPHGAEFWFAIPELGAGEKPRM